MNVLNSFQKGKQQIQEGWRKVIFQDDKDDETILPIVAEGEEGKVVKVKVKEGKTQPPKRYTEGQLITLMKTVGKYLENEESGESIKENRRFRYGSDSRRYYYDAERP